MSVTCVPHFVKLGDGLKFVNVIVFDLFWWPVKVVLVLQFVLIVQIFLPVRILFVVWVDGL